MTRAARILVRVFIFGSYEGMIARVPTATWVRVFMR
jgi:hypothetical protein